MLLLSQSLDNSTDANTSAALGNNTTTVTYAVDENVAGVINSDAIHHRLHCTEGHDDEISGAIFGCLLLEQVSTFGEYFCRFLRPAVAGRRKEKFYHHHNSKVLRSIFGLVSVMALILRLLPLPSLKGHNSAP